jgi:hypothetical protein
VQRLNISCCRLEEGEDSLSADELRLQLRQKENLLTETRLEALRQSSGHGHLLQYHFLKFKFIILLTSAEMLMTILGFFLLSSAHQLQSLRETVAKLR